MPLYRGRPSLRSSILPSPLTPTAMVTASPDLPAQQLTNAEGLKPLLSAKGTDEKGTRSHNTASLTSVSISILKRKRGIKAAASTTQPDSAAEENTLCNYNARHCLYFNLCKLHTQLLSYTHTRYLTLGEHQTSPIRLALFLV